MFGRIREWIGGKAIMWAAKKIGPKLGEALVDELEDLERRAALTGNKADDAGVALLQGIVDPKIRPRETSEALRELAETMAVRAYTHDGKLDDALVIVVRGALNC